MKKLLSTIACLLGAASLVADDAASCSSGNLSCKVDMNYSSEYVYRGHRCGKKALLPRVEVGTTIFDDVKFYVGGDFAVGIERTPDEDFEYHVSPYAGVSYDVTDTVTLDGGYIHRFFVDFSTTTVLSNGNKIPSGFIRDCNEIYVGVGANVILSPALYCFYNFEHRRLDIVGSIGYTYDLSPVSVNGLAVDLGLKVGYDRTAKPWGSKLLLRPGGIADDQRNDYFYFSANADLVYSITENAKAKVGVECAANSAKRDIAWVNDNHTNKFVWFNAAIDCSF
jgi:hypothetical protein